MTRINTQFLVRTALFLAITLVIQMLRLPQYATGPLVNMMLLLSALLVSRWSGIFIGAVTPYIAFTVGILPPPLAPIIPFIMFGNTLYVLIFTSLRVFNQFLGLVLASVAKFAILTVAVRFIIAVPPPVAQMMQIPQLVTAVIGGYAAILITKEFKKRTTSKNGEETIK